MKNYDIVIIGGGIAGIYSMYNLKKKYPKLKVLLLEKDDRFGGRVYSFNAKVDNIDYVMDLGAGRIGHHHKLMVSLIKELKFQLNHCKKTLEQINFHYIEGHLL